jgi:hypothetical protein
MQAQYVIRASVNAGSVSSPVELASAVVITINRKTTLCSSTTVKIQAQYVERVFVEVVFRTTVAFADAAG